jgi:hypothetical protein
MNDLAGPPMARPSAPCQLDPADAAASTAAASSTSTTAAIGAAAGTADAAATTQPAASGAAPAATADTEPAAPTNIFFTMDMLRDFVTEIVDRQILLHHIDNLVREQRGLLALAVGASSAAAAAATASVTMARARAVWPVQPVIVNEKLSHLKSLSVDASRGRIFVTRHGSSPCVLDPYSAEGAAASDHVHKSVVRWLEAAPISVSNYGCRAIVSTEAGDLLSSTADMLYHHCHATHEERMILRYRSPGGMDNINGVAVSLEHVFVLTRDQPDRICRWRLADVTAGGVCVRSPESTWATLPATHTGVRPRDAPCIYLALDVPRHRLWVACGFRLCIFGLKSGNAAAVSVAPLLAFRCSVLVCVYD